MAKPFNELRERLLRAGVAPRHVRRYLRELSDHLADLTAEEVSAGRSGTNADSAALARLGGTDELAKAMIGSRNFSRGVSERRGQRLGLLRRWYWPELTTLPYSFCGRDGRCFCRMPLRLSASA